MRLRLLSVSDKYSLSETRRKEKSALKEVRQNDRASGIYLAEYTTMD